MTEYVTSADGTRIAYDRAGDGPPIVLVSGLLCHRPALAGLAAVLARRLTVLSYDRRGRGESSDTAPYAVEREVGDVAALLEAAGGSAAIYGHSSGAGLALRSAAAGLPLTRLVLHEPPYGGDDAESASDARALHRDVTALLAEGRRGDAIARFMRDYGMPPEALAAVSADPAMLVVAPTMAYDFAVMGEADGGGVPEDVARSVAVPTLVLAGGASPEFFRETARRLADLIPDARLTVLDGQDHGAAADVVAPVVTDFVEG